MAEEIPRTQYARIEGGHVAYQSLGDGPLDIVVVPNWITHVEAMWEIPSIERYLRRLASFARVIVYDHLGNGMSDPIPLDRPAPLEQRMDEVNGVMAAAGSERAAIVGFESGGPMALVFAATYPDKVTALTIIDSYARVTKTQGFEIGIPEEIVKPFFDVVVQTWGQDIPYPNETEPQRIERLRWAKYQRQAASPGVMAMFVRQIMDTDVRDVLPAIRVPTLVLYSDHPDLLGGLGPTVLPSYSKYVADRIPGAVLKMVPHEKDVEPDINFFMDEIREFLTGAREEPEHDRVLATVLFSDIVGSTDLASKLGDRKWKEMLDAHDEMVRRQLERFRGREVKALGDGFMATFDGPARAIACAVAVRDAAHRLGLEVRVGLHTGEVEVRGNDVGGIAVHIASRVADCAAPSEVIVSRTVTDLVAGSRLQFADKGPHELKGLPGEWQLFAVDA
ncbi:MAG: alpha/beta fold hydrolase [Actinomycetota bacterium]|nr:adenylate/guanylate cyclase domain-containing protein [Actinomycetota bacterium]